MTASSDELAAPGYTDTPVLPNSTWRVHDQSRPQPVKVAPGQGDLGATPPSDAIVLFDGSNLDQWEGKNLKAVEEGAFDICKTGFLATKDEFGSCQLHVEWATPTQPVDRMEWGNSGVYLLGSIEVQILESCDSYIYADGNAGAIYGQYPPLVNPARKPGEWQSFDIVFTAPKIKDGKQTEPARVTIFYNGVLVQNNVEILGASLHYDLPRPLTVEKGKILLQEHHSPVKFRNIWVRPLDTSEPRP
ncbi:large, multifunctional secreted protein [Planctomycetales bacterium]|nr:large, multifunctional secreted protein [Planctomycetales bacterium]